MTTLLNILNLDTIVFDSLNQQYANTTLSILGLLAAISNGFIIYGGSQNSKATNTMLILTSLCYGDIILSSSTAVFSVLNSLAGGWVGGKVSCILSEIITETSTLVGLVSMLLISFLNFIKIFRGVRLSDTATVILVAMIWTFSILLSTVVYAAEGYEEYVYLGTSKTGCTIAWFNPIPFIKTISLISVIFILWSIFSLIVVESKACWLIIGVFLFNYYQYKWEKRKVTGRQDDTDQIKESKRIEYKLVTKIVMVLIVYLICWTPQVWFMISSILTECPPSFDLDYYAKLFAIIKSLANPLLILYFDSPIRKQVFMLLGLTAINSQPNTPSRSPKSIRGARKQGVDIATIKFDLKTEIIPNSRTTGLQPSSSNLSKVLEIMRTKSVENELGSSEGHLPSRLRKIPYEKKDTDEIPPQSPLVQENIFDILRAESESKHGSMIITPRLENQSNTRSRKNSIQSSLTKKVDPDEISVAPSRPSRQRTNRPIEESSFGRPIVEQSASSSRNLRMNRPSEENSFGKRPVGESSLASLRNNQGLINLDALLAERHVPRKHSTNNVEGRSVGSPLASASPSLSNVQQIVNDNDASSTPRLTTQRVSPNPDNASQPKKHSPKEKNQHLERPDSEKSDMGSVMLNPDHHEDFTKKSPDTGQHKKSLSNILYDSSATSSERSSINSQGVQNPRKHSPNSIDGATPSSERQMHEQIQMLPIKTTRVHGNLDASLSLSLSPSPNPSPVSPTSLYFKATSNFRQSNTRIHIGISSLTGSRSNLGSRRNSDKPGTPTEIKPVPLLMIEEKSGMTSASDSPNEQN